MKLISSFKLESDFSEVGIVLNYFHKKQYGFIKGLINGESVYFNSSVVENTSRAKMMPRLLVTYSTVHDPQYPEWEQAVVVRAL